MVQLQLLGMEAHHPIHIAGLIQPYQEIYLQIFPQERTMSLLPIQTVVKKQVPLH